MSSETGDSRTSVNNCELYVNIMTILIAVLCCVMNSSFVVQFDMWASV